MYYNYIYIIKFEICIYVLHPITIAYNMSTELVNATKLLSETSRAKKMLKKAHDAHRRGQTALAKHLFAIARRTIRYAKEYDLLELFLTGWNQHTTEPTDELESLYWKEVYLYQLYGLFKDFCEKHRV
jgi:hypothetical protein